MDIEARDRRIGQPDRIGSATVAGYAAALLSNARAAGARLPPVRISLPGLELMVRVPHGPLARAIADTIVPEADAAAIGRKRLAVTILHAGLEGVDAPRPWGEEPYLPHDLGRRLAPLRLQASFSHDDCLWQVMSFEDGVAVQLMQGPEAYPPWEPGAPLRVFLHWAYAALGKRLVHAGTLGHDGRGVLLAGAGGAGKSGTVVAGLLAGLTSVGDDYVLVQLGENVSAAPLYSTLKQDPAGYARLGLAERLGERPLNWQGKHQFHIRELGAAPVPPLLDLRAILLPKTGASRTSLEPAPARDVLLALAPSALWQMPGERASGFHFFSALASRLPGYVLHLGPEPDEIAAQLRRFIEDGRL